MGILTFAEFRERIRNGRLPAYGTLHWNGETGQVVTAVNFELNRQEPAETVCRRAARYFAQLTETEAMAIDIEVVARDGKPVRAILKPRPDTPVVIGTARLREMEQALRRP